MTRDTASRRFSIIGLLVLVLVVGAGFQGWRWYRDSQLGPNIAAAAQPGDIVMLSSTTCSVCTITRQWFQSNQVRFEECYVEKDSSCAARHKASGFVAYPVILVKGQPILGFDPHRVLRTLQRS